MRKKIVAGNWKMNTDAVSSKVLADIIVEGVKRQPVSAELILCPPFISLESICETLWSRGSKIKLGAQNMHYEDNGAFTGEISHTMLKSAGCEYVIIGHSERRRYFGETEETVNKRAVKSLQNNILPIVCIGETLAERQSDKTFDVLNTQIQGGLANISIEEAAKIIIAYEPVWAIGTGVNASPAQAEESHAFIRLELAKMFNPQTAESIPILYGGSVTAANARDLFAQKNVDGGLIGGASLNAESFLAIARSF